MIDVARISDVGSIKPLDRKDLPVKAVGHLDGSRQPTPAFSTVPFQPDPDFVDRPDILEWLHDATTLSCSRMALVGPSGAGKSQIAAQFAREVFQRSPETYVFWVNASSRARLEEAYQSIANLLRLPGCDDLKTDVFELVNNWLFDRRHGPWLIVMDNFEHDGIFISRKNSSTSQREGPLFSSGPRIGHGSILFTSPNQAVVQKLVNQGAIYHVPAMTKSQALQLLHNKVPRHSYSEQELEQLPEVLQNMPLVVNLAATYIQRTYFPRLTREYVENFLQSRKENESIFGIGNSEVRRHDDSASHSVGVIWQTTFDKIQSERPSAADLLFLMSFFNHQGIPRYLLKAYADEQGQEEQDFNKDIDILCQYKLITISFNKDIIMHPLVHSCTRTRLPHGQRLRRMFLSCIATTYPSDADCNRINCQKLEPHLEHIINDVPVNDDVLRWSKLIHRIGTYWRTMKRYSAMEQLVQKCLKVCQDALGNQHRETILTMRDLAVALRCQGRYPEAGQLYNRTLEMASGALGADHQDTRFIRNEYSRALKSEGRHADAALLYEYSLKVESHHKPPPVFPPRRRNLSTGSAPGSTYRPMLDFEKATYGTSHRRGTSEHGSRKRYSRAESLNDITIRPNHDSAFPMNA